MYENFNYLIVTSANALLRWAVKSASCLYVLQNILQFVTLIAELIDTFFLLALFAGRNIYWYSPN
jgi:hypothetical protein